MSTPAQSLPPPQMQRARGRAAVAFSLRGGAVRLDRLHQSGCAKALLPRGGSCPEIVFLNTSGGITGGDRLDYALDLGPGARAVATTQAAERAYASIDTSPAAAAMMRVQMQAGAGARLDWLPQETILFDRAALMRHTSVALRGDAEALICETLVLGRAAMGETVQDLWLSDRREVTRDGRPVLIDPVEIGAPALAARTAPVGLSGARAVAMLALLAPGAETAAGALRALLPGGEVRAAVSGWDGRCVVRLMALDGWPLRRALLGLLRHLRGPALPRVWQN